MQETYSDLDFRNGNDEFSRRPIAEKAIRLLSSDIDLSPMVIDGSWGAGKTVFCHKLINLMKETEGDKFHFLYIDAFRADHADEPLLTVLAAVLNLMPTEGKPVFIKKVVPAARFTVKTILKAGVGHLLRKDTDSVLDDFDEEVQKVADKAIDASVESLLKEHSEAEQSLASLQSALKGLAKDKPILFFIDELDRCRPDFSVNMLEIIKHIFDVEGVKFVLVTNTEQLKAAIKHKYGPTVDAQRYLDKFIKFSFSLSHLAHEGYDSRRLASEMHYLNLINGRGIFYNSIITSGPGFELAKSIIIANELSLREVETVVRHLEIYLTIYPNREFGNDIAIIGLLKLAGVFLHCTKPDLAKTICMNKADAKELGIFLGVNELPILNNSNQKGGSASLVLAILAPECMFNAAIFNRNESQSALWETIISNGLNYSFDNIPFGKRTSVIAKAISSMSLAGH
ncbi:hypothetical protein BCT30_13620 [Enterovibrio norvegicus]|uniref:KAP family P-loop NTPase fold protein n=1 Tax=Enterovibrio norvegicus TaxID=188144 RepID=UPI000C81635E|nr:KAP family NTPase [Enterovibrio norvegicus]PMN52165.1 hypothetical protein BCT30_13620 [Enterovibrio norvegicus]